VVALTNLSTTDDSKAALKAIAAGLFKAAA
jgi:hypothetical protein